MYFHPGSALKENKGKNRKPQSCKGKKKLRASHLLKILHRGKTENHRVALRKLGGSPCNLRAPPCNKVNFIKEKTDNHKVAQGEERLYASFVLKIIHTEERKRATPLG